MTPFQQFRLWLRRAPVGERVSATIAAAVVLALLVWVAVPAGKTSSTGLRTNGGNGNTSAASNAAAGTSETVPGASANAGAAGGTATGGTSAGGAATGTSGSGSTGGATSVGGSGCASPPGSDQGVTDTQIKVAVVLVNIFGPAANSTFGVPPASEQQLDYQQVADAINASGGVACRKLALQFFTGNPANNSDRQQKCLDVAQAKPFFVIDAGAYYGTPLSNCFPQNQLPFLSTGRLTVKQRDQFYPYMFSTGNVEELYRNMVFGLKERAFFTSNGFRKLGVAYQDCFPEVYPAFIGWLNQAGVPSSQIVSYNFGCPEGFASPSDIQAAILKFQQNGVTHVTEEQFFANFANFTKVAQQQGFKPKYGLADDGIVPITGGNLSPDHDNLDGAIAITGDRYGEESTPGLSPTAGTQKCDAIYAAKGRPPVWKQPVGFGGVTCDQLWLLIAAIAHAPSMQRSAIAPGLHAAKTIDFSFPRGPADFTGPKVTYGGQAWRPEQFLKSCGCWRILDAAFKPSFQ